MKIVLKKSHIVEKRRSLTIIKKTHQFHRIKNFEKCLTVPKNSKEGTLWVFIIQFVAENQNNQREDPLVTSKSFGKKSNNAENKPVKPSELSSNDKSFKNFGITRDCLLVR